jgi:uncharacterized protein (TIGR02271 family)
MERESRSDGFTAIEDRFAGYEVYDQDYDKIGKVDDLFVDENDNPEYIGVKMGFLGTRTTLIPMDIVKVNDERRLVQVEADKDTVKEGPTFNDDREITPKFEDEVYSYYGLRRATTTGVRPTYGAYQVRGTTGTATGPSTRGGVDRADSVAAEDELRVRRVEEELVAGTREREVGAVRVRKRVVTERQRMEIPTRREEVRVDRVPVVGEATEAEIGEEEVVIPVTEEEVVVEKRPVAKEEVRIRKDVVEDTEVVEEDVRREEVDVDDDQRTR